MSKMTIKDASGEIRSENWPPSDVPKMSAQVANQKRREAEDAYQEFKANNGGLKSYSYSGAPYMGKIKRIDNNSGASEWVDV